MKKSDEQKKIDAAYILTMCQSALEFGIQESRKGGSLENATLAALDCWDKEVEKKYKTECPTKNNHRKLNERARRLLAILLEREIRVRQ
jgi:hypothetical protein